MHALKILAAVAASLTITACASGGTSGGMRIPDGPGAGRQHGASTVERAVVRVSNYNWMDVVIYAVQGNTRVRLGQVTTMGTASFRLPRGMVSKATQQVRLMVDPVGSTQGWQTEGISVQAGQRVQLNVQNALRLSSVLVSH